MKAETLCYLYENQGKIVSGEEISRSLNISRTAVWKHIGRLRDEGYPIESIPQKGYKLVVEPSSIFPCVLEKKFGKPVFYFQSIGSTNGYLKENLPLHKDGTIVISDEQTKGRGRMGRDWYSPKGKGLFLSLLLKPSLQIDEIFAMTSVVAVSIYRIMKKNYDVPVKIKWPNDLVVEGKKIAGILTEISGELDGVNNLIVGMGVNLHNEFFHKEIQHQATSLYLEKNLKVSRHEFSEALLEEFFKNYDTFLERRNIDFLLDDLCKASSVLGKEIDVIEGSRRSPATALEITREGFLKVRYEEGIVELLRSGEISIRESMQELNK